MIPKCGCKKPAEYLVYEHEEPHCKGCMLDAVDCEMFVLVRKPLDWREWENAKTNKIAHKNIV